MNRPTNPANVNSRTHSPGEHTCRTHHSPTPTTNGQNADCRRDENAWPFPVLHNLILAEVFHARPEALTVTELFQRTHGRFTASGLLEFARAVVWLEEEGLLEPVASEEFAEGHANKNGPQLVESLNKRVAAAGVCNAQRNEHTKEDHGQQRLRHTSFSWFATQQFTERCIKSTITAKGEMYLFGQSQPQAAALHGPSITALHDSALHSDAGKLAKPGIADGLTPVAEPTSQHVVEQILGPAPETPNGNSGDAASKLTSPLETAADPAHAIRSNAQSESTPRDGDQSSVIEQLFPEVFCATERQRMAARLEDLCHCGELADCTCPCGARACHNHLYDGDGNLARRDHAGFCAECVDLIREEAAGIERCGRTQ